MKPSQNDIVKYLQGQQKDAGEADKDILIEIEDILEDYNALAKQVSEMQLYFKHPDPTIWMGKDVYLCPGCHHRTHPKHSHCHWCGKACASPGGN